jgi:hypothetical protein
MASTLFEVTATALHLRAAPSRDSASLALLRHGQVLVSTAVAAHSWLPVVHEGRPGFVAADFVRALGAVGSAPLPAPVVPAAVAVDVNLKQRDLMHLHPHARQRVQQVLQQLGAEGLDFRVFEAFRSAERQQWLFAQGRTRPGAKVTHAGPWQSFHQFGLAVDLVQFCPAGWSWDDKGARAADWQRLQAVVVQSGLRTLNFERPHAELRVDLADWHDGTLLASGDASWHDNLAAAAERWRRAGGSGAPEVAEPERPPLPPDAL